MLCDQYLAASRKHVIHHEQEGGYEIIWSEASSEASSTTPKYGVSSSIETRYLEQGKISISAMTAYLYGSVQ